MRWSSPRTARLAGNGLQQPGTNAGYGGQGGTQTLAGAARSTRRRQRSARAQHCTARCRGRRRNALRRFKPTQRNREGGTHLDERLAGEEGIVGVVEQRGDPATQQQRRPQGHVRLCLWQRRERTWGEGTVVRCVNPDGVVLERGRGS